MTAPRQLKYVDPLRNPRYASPEVRDRRGWVLLLTSFFIPGAVQSMLGNRKLGRWALRVTLITWGIAVFACWHSSAGSGRSACSPTPSC